MTLLASVQPQKTESSTSVTGAIQRASLLPVVGDEPNNSGQAQANWNGDWDKWDNWDQWDQSRH